MDGRNVYKTPLLSAKILAKETREFSIAEAYCETVTGQDKTSKDRIIIEDDEGDTRVSLNKTNYMRLAVAFGHETDDWIGKRVTVSVHKVQMNGKDTDGLLVQPAKRKK